MKEWLKKNKFEILFFGISGLLVASCAYGISNAQKIKKNEGCFNAAVHELADRTTIDGIKQSLIDEAMKEAVERKAAACVSLSAKDAVREVTQEFAKDIKNAVQNSYSDIKGAVKNELAKQVAKIDISDLKDEVKDEAKEAIMEKFNDNLDDALEGFNDSLGNIKKIYESIAKTVASNGNADKEKTFKFVV